MWLWMTFVLCGPAPVSAASAAQSAEDEVAALVERFNRDYERNELDAYFAHYAPDATIWFDSGRVTLDAYRQDWYQMVNEGGGVERNAISDLRVQVGPSGDVAVATYGIEVHTRLPDGNVSIDRAHETDVWFKGRSGWKIAHLHYSTEPPSDN